MANVTANSDVLVVDMVGGLLTGAVAERLGGLFYVHSLQIVNFSLFFLGNTYHHGSSYQLKTLTNTSRSWNRSESRFRPYTPENIHLN